MSELKPLLTNLFKEWDAFCKERNVTYFLAHGTLLGWYWGRRIQAWDTDVDLQMRLNDMKDLFTSNYEYNSIDNIGTNGNFFLEFNPYFMKKKISINNIIDMRFIDKSTGIFIDITNVFPVNESEMRERLGTF